MSTTNAEIKLAKSYAEVRGFEGRPGGWIYNPAGKPVAHGWQSFAALLRRRRRIISLPDGRPAINWRADDIAGRFAA